MLCSTLTDRYLTTSRWNSIKQQMALPMKSKKFDSSGDSSRSADIGGRVLRMSDKNQQKEEWDRRDSHRY